MAGAGNSIQEMMLDNPLFKKREAPKNNLGKDDFLKLLITELRHQDPTNAMQDKEFIAQMAQFSALEQTQNMAKQLSDNLAFSQLTQSAMLVGTHVEVQDVGTGSIVKGPVDWVQMVEGKAYVKVNTKLYPINSILRVGLQGGTANA